jgi:enoyl-CoA hydratase
MSEPDAVRYERRGTAALLTIDRQHRRNAVDGPTAAALHEAYLRFEADEEARVLVLTGAGGVSFCAGADLKATDTFRERLMAEEGPLGFTRLTPSKPTIAAISGFCLAGGLELALWCDLRIATGTSTLGYPERRWGVPLIDGGTQRLPRLIGLGRALDLILTGRMIGAEEALSMGLLTEVVPPGAHLERALGLAEGLASFPQRTMLADRRAAIDGLGMTLEQGLALEAKTGPEVFEDGARGAARFAAGEGRSGAGAGA